MAIPIFGALANFACMAFYVIGPMEGLGSVKEPLMAVESQSSGASTEPIYFIRNSKKKGKETARHQARLGNVVPPLCGPASPQRFYGNR